MDFIGPGKRLAANDVGDAARALGVETAVLLAFLEVEAAGLGFDNRSRPKMLRETHIFYRELGPGPKRERAVAAGLATKTWTRNYSRDSYPDLARMMQIDARAALRSCSWGLPQIMGFNHTLAGFTSAEQMVETMKRGEREQLFALVTLMQAWNMRPMLTGKDFTKPDSWKDAARKYNGAGFSQNGYHTRLAAAYRKHKGKTDSPVNGGPVAQPGDVLQFGMKGELVLNLQNDLVALGYSFAKGVDGRFGNETKAHVITFQKSQSLVPDGRVGPETRDALRRAVAALGAVAQPPAPQRPEDTEDEPVAKSGRFWTWITTGGGTALLPMVDWRVQVVIAAAVVGVAIYAIATMPQVRKRIGDMLA
jgi:peptidoglycan hydrolase-like protein with peptidoglycan-binding domain